MHDIKRHYVGMLVTAGVALTALGGCANPPPPIADLTEAGTLVSQAQENGAPRYDSADLTAAQDRLQRAHANARSHPDMAAQLAQEAAADARLALARTRAGKEQDALTQVHDSLAALHGQATESEPRASDTGAAVSTPVPSSEQAPSSLPPSDQVPPHESAPAGGAPR